VERAAIEAEGEEDGSWAVRRDAARERAQRRARVAVKDLGLSNPWKYFVTLTLDRAKINRYDPREVVRRLNHWLDNQVRRHGLSYVLVPEHHKDGAIHFHGFFNGAIRGVDSGHKDKGGHAVYNLPAWGWGFSTAIELYGERRQAVNYVCKYIGKQREKIGGRWYYSGGNLQRPRVEWFDVDFDALAAGRRTFSVDGLPGTRFVGLAAEGHKNLVNAAIKSQDSCERLTISGLSNHAAIVDAATGETIPLSRMAQEKTGGLENINDHGIPFESGGQARFGGSHAAKCPDRGNHFTYGAPDFGRPGAQDRPAEAVHVGRGKEDREAPPVRPALGPFVPYRRPGRACVGVPRRKAWDAQNPAGCLEGYQTRLKGFPSAPECWGP